jgi:hypothetical protein
MTWPLQSADLNPIVIVVWDELDRRAVATRHSGQVGQSLSLPVLHVILALIHVTYQFANNVKKYISLSK